MLNRLAPLVFPLVMVAALAAPMVIGFQRGAVVNEIGDRETFYGVVHCATHPIGPCRTDWLEADRRAWADRHPAFVSLVSKGSK